MKRISFEAIDVEPYQPVVDLFKVLSHPTRLSILEMLRNGEECVCHMTAMLGSRQAYVSQQLMALREAGLVIDRRDGWNINYRVTRPEVYAVLDAVYGMAGGAFQEASSFRPNGGRNGNPEICPYPKCQGLISG